MNATSVPWIVLALTPLLFASTLLSCKRPAPTPATEPSSAAPSSPSLNATPLAHDPNHPPIDCPLHKAGIDPHGLKPFQDTEEYLAFLERPERGAWQKPDEVVASLGLTGDETIVDVGAGSGYFAFRFARALPRGKVFATDIEPAMVRHIHHKAMTEGVTNLEVALGDPDDPKVPGGATHIFVCDVLHHVKNPSSWLSKMHAEAAANTRLVVIEFAEGDLPQGPPKAMRLTRAQVTSLATQAGFVKATEDSTLLPYQYILTFAKR